MPNAKVQPVPLTDTGSSSPERVTGLTLQQRAESLGAKQFLGVPLANFADGGREQLTYLLRAGLNPQSKLCDLGCGVLRAGYWLIHLLDAGCYCGIEPHTGRLQMGIHTILEPGVIEAKRPRFDTNARFDTSVFGEQFDFFLAYSIWTHASKRHIQMMLDSFVRDSHDHSAFLTTYLPATWFQRDYLGDSWIGTSHQSDVPGCIHHRLSWIRAECTSRGLVMFELGRDVSHDQCWLEIRHRAIAPVRRRRHPFWLRRLIGPLVRDKQWLATHVSQIHA
jgi:hypothetical protein